MSEYYSLMHHHQKAISLAIDIITALELMLGYFKLPSIWLAIFQEWVSFLTILETRLLWGDILDKLSLNVLIILAILVLNPIECHNKSNIS